MTDAKVYLDYGRHSAIVLDQTDTYIRLIELDEGELCVRKMREEEFVARAFRLTGYPVAGAARVYLAHYAGVSAKARAVLEALEQS
jgi:hypothetical protein